MRLSIITIVFNDEKNINKTLNSVFSQTCSSFEYIIIDGASTDRTLDIIRSHPITPDVLISEADAGIADAFNKGVLSSSGDYIYFLNSGDILHSESVIASVLDFLKGEGIVVGKVSNPDGKIVGDKFSLKKQKYRNYLPHQGMFIPKVLFNTVGYYNESFKLGMDYEWSLRLLSKFPKTNFLFIELHVADMLADGRSVSNYNETFRLYHSARCSHNTTNVFYSFLIFKFYFLKRTIGNYVRRLKSFIKEK